MPGPIKVTLRKEPNSKRALADLIGPGGESASVGFELPWDETQWPAVFWSLELLEEDRRTWPQDKVRQKARELGLFLPARPSDSRFEIIGRRLYDAIFCSEEIRKLLDRSLHLLYAEGEIPVVEFHIQDEGSILQAYPWELLYDEEGFLFDEKRAFPVRHVDFSESITHIELSEALSVLYVAPRPDMSSYENYAKLPIREKRHLEYLSRYYPDHLALEFLPVNTLDALQKHLIRSQNSVHVVHIDTHGGFGWLCRCKHLNPPRISHCSKCNSLRPKGKKDRGYLAFETSDGDVDWISGDDLGKRLHKRGVQVVVLSACQSGLVGGNSTFNSVAGALVKRRIPAVVSMQFSIDIRQAEKFAEFFYFALMNGMPLVEAVAEARIALSADSKDSWYRPVLYLRTDVSNYLGKIFEPRSPLGLPKKLGPREKWIARLGFRRDPFYYTDGGTDPFLQEYYYKVRHFRDIFDVSRPGTAFIFGPPGSGKSSMRNVISQLCRKSNIFPVVYQDFGPLVCKHREGKRVQVKDYVEQILRVALRTLVKADLVEGLDEEESKIMRNQLWLYASSYDEKDPLRSHALRDLLKPDSEAEGVLPADTRELMGRFCRYVTKLFGYQSVYVLVDPDKDIDPDEEIAWQVLKPLLTARRVLELSEDKVIFKFFLGQKFQKRALQIPWIEQERSKRVYPLEWPDEELRALLQARLAGCSGGRYKNLGELSEVDDLDDRVVRLSMGSPRELIVICNRLFSEHSRKWSPDDGEPLLITDQEVEEVLSPFEERYPKSPLEQLIARGESERVEFKSTMRYNLRAGRPDKEIEREIARTICAFMNTEGGTLIIGVDDDGTVLGLDKDFSTLGRRKNEDGFHQAFVNITENLFNPPLSPDDYAASFEKCHDKLVYVVKVKKSEKPAFCLFSGVNEFYLRKQTTTRKLDAKATLEYCLEHF